MLLVPVTRNQLVACLPRGLAMAEIGVARGEFSRVLIDTCSPTRLHMIDPWRHQTDAHLASDSNNPDQLEQDRRFAQVSADFARELESGQAVLSRAFSHEAAEAIEDGSLDMVYVDGDHSYDGVMRDLEAFASKLRPGGVIMGHDYTWHARVEFGVVPAVNDFVQHRGYSFLMLNTLDIFPTFAIAPELAGTAESLVGAVLSHVRGVVEISGYPGAGVYRPKSAPHAAGGVSFVPSFAMDTK